MAGQEGPRRWGERLRLRRGPRAAGSVAVSARVPSASRPGRGAATSRRPQSHLNPLPAWETLGVPSGPGPATTPHRRHPEPGWTKICTPCKSRQPAGPLGRVPTLVLLSKPEPPEAQLTTPRGASEAWGVDGGHAGGGRGTTASYSFPAR